MESVLREIPCHEVHANLREIPDPPATLWVRGTLPPAEHTLLAIVGSRRYTRYGEDVATHLIAGLAGCPLSIVSGLALGIDGIAHRAALRAGLRTIALPGSGLDDRVLYPASHRGLAHDILQNGGALISEFAPTFKATRWSFPQRNRLMAGLAHATLLIEAGERSGTLITARLACEYDRDLLVVPGSIFSKNSYGVHQFLKLGATPVTTPEDVCDALGLHREMRISTPSADLTDTQREVLAYLEEPRTTDDISARTGRSPHELSVLLTSLELSGLIELRDGMIRKIRS